MTSWPPVNINVMTSRVLTTLYEWFVLQCLYTTVAVFTPNHLCVMQYLFVIMTRVDGLCCCVQLWSNIKCTCHTRHLYLSVRAIPEIDWGCGGTIFTLINRLCFSRAHYAYVDNYCWPHHPLLLTVGASCSPLHKLWNSPSCFNDPCYCLLLVCVWG